MQFVAVVNSYNRRHLLEEALASLVEAVDSDAVPYAIVVFDPGSTDGSREWIRWFAQEHPGTRIDLIGPAGGEGSSFADGVNRGCQYALESFPDAEFLLLYETDNWIANADPLHGAMRLLRAEPSLAAAGFTVRLHSGKPCGWGMAFPTLSSFMLGDQLCHNFDIPRSRIHTQQTDGVKWFAADVVFTSPLLVKAQVWRESGGIDAEAFPFSDSDLDWAWKVSRLGYKLGVLLTDGVVHDNLSVQSDWSNMRVLKFHRARFNLLRKYRGRAVYFAIPLLFVRHLAEYSLLAMMVLFRRRPTLSLKKRALLMKTVWSGYRLAGQP
jgi:GT2 family glycosyltransferase